MDSIGNRPEMRTIEKLTSDQTKARGPLEEKFSELIPLCFFGVVASPKIFHEPERMR